MATLEKQKRNRQSRARQSSLPSSSNQGHSCQPPVADTLSDDNLLELLMLEPMEYDESTQSQSSTSPAVPDTVSDGHLLPREALIQMENMRRKCLSALDGLLQRIVRDASPSTMENISNIACSTTFTSMAYNAKRLACVTAAEFAHVHFKQHIRLQDALDIVGRLVESPQFWLIVSNEDAVLSRTLYETINIIGEIAGSHRTEDHAAIDPQHVHLEINDAVAIYKQSTFTQTTSGTQLSRLGQLVDNLARMSVNSYENLKDTTSPPAYSEAVVDAPLLGAVDEKLPDYDGRAVAKNEKAERDLDMILSAVDHLSNVTSQLNNQRVNLTERQKKAFARATAAEASPRRRCNDQRALNPAFKSAPVYQLFAQIFRSATRRFDNRRVPLNVKLQRELDSAAECGLQERLDCRRLTDQDWSFGNKQRKNTEVNNITDLLAKSLHRPEFSKQRYALSVDKERDMFMARLLHKVDRLEGWRLINQDAEQPTPRTVAALLADQDDEELDLLLNRICRAKRSQYDNQRACFSNSSRLANTIPA